MTEALTALDSSVAGVFEAMLAEGERADTGGEAAAELRALIEQLTLEQLVTDAELGALPASDVQRALIRAADGRPIDGLLDEERCLYHFKCTPEELGERRPRYVIVRGGVRSGKSLIAAIAMVLSALICTLRRPAEKGEIPSPVDGLVGVRPGEFVRVIVVAPQKSLTRAAFTHAAALIQQSPKLRPLLVSDPLKESLSIRRPDGQVIEIQIVAAAGAGATLRSTWLAGVFFDEADFHKDGEAVVNLDDNFKAVKARLLPGAQAWLVSSPWCEDTSFDKLFAAAWGHPGRELGFHADSRSMNPTLDREEEEAERARDPDNHAREYLAIPLTTNSSEYFPKDALEACINRGRDVSLAPNGFEHTAGADLGFRRNSSAIAFARTARGKAVLAYYLELRPKPKERLKPSAVCEAFAQDCHAYDAKTVLGDLWYADTAHEEFAKHRSRSHCDPTPWSVAYAEYDSKDQAETFAEFLRRMREGLLDLPDDPRLLNQIRGVKRVFKPGGVVGIKLPNQGAAHADVLQAVVLACVQVPIVEADVGDANEPDPEELLDRPRWGSGRGFG